MREYQVTPSELAEIMRGLGDKLSDEEIDLLVKVADKNGDGTISIEEWVIDIRRMCRPKQQVIASVFN